MKELENKVGAEIKQRDFKKGFWVITNPENIKECIVVFPEHYVSGSTYAEYLDRRKSACAGIT